MNTSASRVTLVTTCMQRRDFLERSLPTWLEHTDFAVLVVDYSCPQNTSEWIASQGFGERVRTTFHTAEIKEGRALFNPARARNVGAAAAFGMGEYLLFIDADVQALQGLQEGLEALFEREAMLAVVGRPSSLFGLLGVHRDAFRAVGGYDEGFTGWGGEDIDLRIRLHLQGLRCAPFPEDLVRSMPHSNGLRSRNSAEPDFRAARKLNEEYFSRKLWENTGRTFQQWIEDPSVDCLLRRRGEPLPGAPAGYR